MNQPVAINKELKNILRKVDSAMSALASELNKGGNIPYAYAELRTAKHDLQKAISRTK